MRVGWVTWKENGGRKPLLNFGFLKGGQQTNGRGSTQEFVRNASSGA